MRLTASLQNAGIAAWTPTEHNRRRLPRGKVTEHRIVPLAPTYVFVRSGHLADLQRIERAEITPHPRFSIFRHCGETVFLPNGSLHQLRQLQQASYRASLPGSGRRAGKPQGEPFAAGQTIKFEQGPFTGVEAFVEKSDGLLTMLTLHMFGGWSEFKMGTLQLRSHIVPADTSAAKAARDE